MTDLKHIEHDFLTLEPLDHEELDKFFRKNRDLLLFSTVYEGNKSKTLQILIEIACSYTFVNQHKEALMIIDRIRDLLGTGDSNDLNRIEDFYYCSGRSNHAERNYLQALADFKKLRTISTDKTSVDILIKESRDKLVNRWLFRFAVIGGLILIFKYTTKWFFPEYYTLSVARLGWVGAITLLGYGTFYKSTSKKNTV